VPRARRVGRRERERERERERGKEKERERERERETHTGGEVTGRRGSCNESGQRRVRASSEGR
jgi:hypothetical protein